MNQLQTVLLGFFLMISLQTFAQQTYTSQQLAGTWQFVQMDGKDLPSMNGDISMTFDTEGTLTSKVADKQQTASWKLADDKTTLLIKSELGDEKWKIIELSKDRLVFEDQKKHQLAFKKTQDLPKKDDSKAKATDQAPEELYGNWKVVSIDGKEVPEQNMKMVINKDRTLAIEAVDNNSAGKWTYNAQKEALLVRWEKTEVWEIISLQADKMTIKDQNRTLSLTKIQ